MCEFLLAQHRHMLDQVPNYFGIAPSIDLNIMRPDQALTTLTARLLLDLDDVLLAEKPDIVIAQGDTTTVMTVALACFIIGYRLVTLKRVCALGI